MNKIHLSLAIHNHQPVGNFDWIFENAALHAYEPMLAALERHPGVRVALHYSGSLLDWLSKNRPALIKRIRALAKSGQIEILTGGYYEPILVALPDADKLGQIKKLTAAIKKEFGYAATGAWLAERVWEPHLPKPLAEAGVQYTIVDDTHFQYVGLSDENLLGYYVTEEQGYLLKLLASSKFLRYAIPWRPVTEVIEWLRGQADASGTRVAVMGDDGEKFGLWPGSFEHCWKRCWDDEQGWIEQFFAALEANADWLITTPPGEYVAVHAPAGRAYLPSASYDEMTEWALPPEQSAEVLALKQSLQAEGREDILKFLKGGSWRSFMAKYAEINAMHKKMLHVSAKAHRIKDRAARAKALDALWAGQCNCPYWHGVFGGIYLFHIREAAYEKLIAAEALADAAAHGPGAWVQAQVMDINRDTLDEVILSSDAQRLTFEPAYGGALVGWDWRAVGVNLVNTLTRRPEGYHRILREAAERGQVILAGQPPDAAGARPALVHAKEMGLEKKLCYDQYRRVSLLDHVLPATATLEQFACGQCAGLGNFAGEPYTAWVDQLDAQASLALARDGYVRQGDAGYPLRIVKTITLAAGQLTLQVAYSLTNLGAGPIAARFGVETNWGLSGGDGPQAYSVWPGGNLARWSEPHAVSDAGEAALVNEWFGRIVVASDRQADWWHFPIETISNSESGFERVYQGTCLLTHWPLELAPGAEWQVTLRFKLA